MQTSIDWIDPLTLVTAIAETERFFVLLYSGMRSDYTGRYSYLALRPEEHITGNDFTALAAALTVQAPTLHDRWFGYLGYGLGHSLETLPPSIPSSITPPPLWMIRYRLVLVFDHDKHHITVFAKNKRELHYLPVVSNSVSPTKIPHIITLSSNMSKAAYLDRLAIIKQAINNGELYQANLTRKFFGTIKYADPIGLFKAICAISPAPYSALLRYDNSTLISSSPEQFIHLDNNEAVSRPIKGSAPRFIDSKQDAQSKAALIESEKNRAENLMIVDLMRNDLARSCIPGSVKVSSLFDCTSYATIHHLSSTVTGTKRSDLTALDLIKGCFPPGSMTGTPKIKAMELCAQLEAQERGIYSGCLGWMERNTADLSVVIRTLILQDNKYEFQVGGAIVADSVAEEEWQETLTKAKAIANVLGISQAALEAL